MADFETLTDKLLGFKEDIHLKIKGDIKTIRGIALYRTLNMGDDEYIKVFFTDNSFVLLLLTEKEVYYDPMPVGCLESVADDEVGEAKELVYKGKKYVLKNQHDYQYVKQLVFGDIKSIEGEVEFSDYYPEDETESGKEFLSVGFLMYSGERADLNPTLLDLAEVEVLKK